MTSGRGPRVSVIIPVHNTGRFLQECFGSIFDQTLSQSEIEIIAIDDGSTDESLEMLEQLALGRPNMRVLHQEASGSAAKPRNVGIGLAQGEYLFFLDSDDYLARETLEELLQMADASGSGVVLPRMDTVGSSRDRASTAVKRTAEAVDFIESRAYRTYHPGKLFRASIIRENNLLFPTGYRIGEDMPFTLAAYLHSPHVSFVGDRPLYHLRWRADASSLRQAGQTALEVFEKNATMLRLIQRSSRPEADRIILLQRCVLGRGGLWVLFTESYLKQSSPAEQKALFMRVHVLLREVWKPEYRRRGSVNAHVMVALAWAGDFDGVMEFSRRIAGGEAPPLKRRPPWGDLAYVSGAGTVVRDVMAAPKAAAAQRGAGALGRVRRGPRTRIRNSRS